MFKFLRAMGPWAVAAVLLLGGFLVVTGFSSLNPFRSKPFTNYGATVVQSVQELSELTSIEYVEYTTIEKGNDRGLLNWAKGDRIYLFALARIGAGVDLDDLTADQVDIDGDRIRITLPPAEIFYTELDQEATQVYDRDTGIFTSGDKDLETETRREAAKLLEQKALEAGILDDATQSAVDTLTAFLTGLGFEDIEVSPAPPPDPGDL